MIKAEGFDEELATFLTDASKFVTTFKTPIETSVPHIYISALPFCPVDSVLLKQFKSNFPKILDIQTGRTTTWPQLELILEGHTDDVLSVGYSPNGKHVVSSSSDGTIRLWDAETGEQTAAPFT